MRITKKTIEGLITQTKVQAAACRKISSDPIMKRKCIDAESLRAFKEALADIIVSAQGLPTYEDCKERAEEETDVLLATLFPLQQEQPSLPSGLDEAAEEYANKEYPNEPAVGQWGTGDYEPPIDMEYPREVAKDAFIAGAEWQANQGASYETVISADKTIPILSMKDVSEMGFNYGDKVIVQIGKK